MPDIMNGTNFRQRLAADVAEAGGPAEPRPEDADAVGRTLFDLPGSADLAVTVVVPKAKVRDVPLQALVRIASRADGRSYLGVVTAGPFAEPDGLRGDSPMLTAVATHGGTRPSWGRPAGASRRPWPGWSGGRPTPGLRWSCSTSKASTSTCTSRPTSRGCKRPWPTAGSSPAG